MNLNCRKWISLVLWAIALASEPGVAQTNPPPSMVAYALQPGSWLIDCPLCDRLPVIWPLQGTFLLNPLESNPLFRRYELKDIAFQAGTNTGPQYTISGHGTYQVGGEVAYQQDLVLNLTIDYGFGQTVASYSNFTRTVQAPWPVIDAIVDQITASVFPMFQLHIIAAPMPRFIAIHASAADVLLEWETSSQPVQLERAERIEGPYMAVTEMTAKTTYLDVGILTNRVQSFYRLHV
jgi:hypothetical protein